MTDRLELRPIPAAAAAALPVDRAQAASILGAALAREWPQPDLLDVLPLQASASPGSEPFGVWAMIERETATVVGDIGFTGPPDHAGAIEVGYSVIPIRRRRGYATEAAHAIVAWAVDQPEVKAVLARCDSDNLPSIRILERIGFRRAGEENGRISWRYEPEPSGRGSPAV
jgi:RimJ/RimL family protein N-acetyltransferase